MKYYIVKNKIKEFEKEKINCSNCGCFILKSNLLRHQKTAKYCGFIVL